MHDIQKLYRYKKLQVFFSRYLYSVMGESGDVFGQQDQDGSSTLPLGLEVIFCGEVRHLHDDAAARQHRFVCRARLRHHDGPTATSQDRRQY